MRSFRARMLVVICLQAFVTFSLADSVRAQTRPAIEFQLTKINRNLVSTAQISYTGAQQYPTNQRDR